jgi:hypothetical protein
MDSNVHITSMDTHQQIHTYSCQQTITTIHSMYINEQILIICGMNCDLLHIYHFNTEQSIRLTIIAKQAQLITSLDGNIAVVCNDGYYRIEHHIQLFNMHTYTCLAKVRTSDNIKQLLLCSDTVCVYLNDSTLILLNVLNSQKLMTFDMEIATMYVSVDMLYMVDVDRQLHAVQWENIDGQQQLNRCKLLSKTKHLCSISCD